MRREALTRVGDLLKREMHPLILSSSSTSLECRQRRIHNSQQRRRLAFFRSQPPLLTLFLFGGKYDDKSILIRQPALLERNFRESSAFSELLCCMQHSRSSIYSQSSFIYLPQDNQMAYLPKALKKSQWNGSFFSHKKLLPTACYCTYLCVSLMLSSQTNFCHFHPELSLLVPLFSWQIHDKTIIRLRCLRKSLKLVPLKCIRHFLPLSPFS